MPSSEMHRGPVACSVPVGTSLVNSDPIPAVDFAGGFVHVPSTEGSTITLSYYVSTTDDPDGTYQVAYSYTGTQIQSTVDGGKSYEMSPSLSSALWMKIVASAISSGTSVSYEITGKS